MSKLPTYLHSTDECSKHEPCAAGIVLQSGKFKHLQENLLI